MRFKSENYDLSASADLGPEDRNADAFVRENLSRPKVLLLAYSISPVRGSEFAVCWNHVTYLSEFCDLTVIYGVAGEHMGDFEEIEDYIARNGELKNVRFVAVTPNRLARALNFPNRKGAFVYSFYFAFRIWQKQAARLADAILAEEKIDLIHFLGPIGYREPGFLWKLHKPYIWGPLGGLNMTLLLKRAPRPLISKLKVIGKNISNLLIQTLSIRVRKAFSRADYLVVATTETQKIVLKKFGRTSEHMPENAIPDNQLRSPIRGPDKDWPEKRFIWIGRLDWNKSPDLLLDALAAVVCKNWTIDIVGTGPLLPMAEARAFELGISERVTFHGHIPRTEVQNLLENADLHLITSMGEANTTVLWEAMSAGVPTLTLDHCGMHDVVCENCGVKVQIAGYASTRDNIASAIDNLLISNRRLEELSDGVLSCRQQYLWSNRSRRWLAIYRDTIERSKT